MEATRFIPIRRNTLLPLLLNEREDDDAFADVARSLHHVLRFEADDRAEAVHAAYDPFDPDPLVPSEGDGDPDAFLEAAGEILEEANFRRVADEELQEAFAEKSLFPLRAEVDLDDYDILRLYRRGHAERGEKVRGWSTLWRWRTRRLELYERLVVIMRLKPEALEDRTFRTAGMEPGCIYLKSFKNIPKADVEMVLPNARLRMRPVDRALVGGPLVAGLGWTVFQSLGVLAAVIAGGFALSLDDPRLRALGGVLLVLAGYLWRTMNKVKNTRLGYLQTLSQGLYFRNLANNRAVLQQVLDFAQNEEEKEALLVYHFLTHEGHLSRADLDRHVEAWLRRGTGRNVDFDVQDGMARLQALDLVRHDGGRWQAVSLQEASARLDRRWNAGVRAYRITDEEA